jgi:hypothetical protein
LFLLTLLSTNIAAIFELVGALFGPILGFILPVSTFVFVVFNFLDLLLRELLHAYKKVYPAMEETIQQTVLCRWGNVWNLWGLQQFC